jgi:hypothetical protein
MTYCGLSELCAVRKNAVGCGYFRASKDWWTKKEELASITGIPLG